MSGGRLSAIEATMPFVLNFAVVAVVLVVVNCVDDACSSHARISLDDSHNFSSFYQHYYSEVDFIFCLSSAMQTDQTMAACGWIEMSAPIQSTCVVDHWWCMDVFIFNSMIMAMSNASCVFAAKLYGSYGDYPYHKTCTWRCSRS